MSKPVRTLKESLVKPAEAKAKIVAELYEQQFLKDLAADRMLDDVLARKKVA